MKELYEKRAILMNELEEMENKLDSTDTQELSEKDLKDMQEKIKEIKDLDKQIELQKQLKSLKNTVDKEVENNMDNEKRAMLVEGKEVEIRNMTKTNVKGESVQNGQLITDRKKELGLKDFVRIEKFNGNTVVPVQKQKMGKLVKASELTEISKKDILVEQVDLRPEKYALLTVVSEELMNDASYDVENLIREEGNQAIEETIEGMIADTLNNATGVVTVSPKARGVIALDDINNLYFGLKAKYRKNAVWVVNDTHLKALAGLTGTDGHPILVRDLVNGLQFKLMGKPVVLCDDITDMMFVDLEKAIVCGVGTNAQVKRSDDAFFTTGGVAFRISVALDCKSAISSAIAKLA